MWRNPLGFASAALALRTSLALVSVACGIGAAEDFVHRTAFRTHRLLSWEIERTEYRDGTLLLRALDGVFAWPNINVLLALRLAAPVGTLCAAFVVTRLPWFAVWPLFLTTLLWSCPAETDASISSAMLQGGGGRWRESRRRGARSVPNSRSKRCAGWRSGAQPGCR
ncbi:hypothetical protein tb265_45140 [Gemmatimonadetes bacterium T265]|nr:hypothetical protein tb265_45140 [Gemmatimonadetes bacterium T265]